MGRKKNTREHLLNLQQWLDEIEELIGDLSGGVSPGSYEKIDENIWGKYEQGMAAGLAIAMQDILEELQGFVRDTLSDMGGED